MIAAPLLTTDLAQAVMARHLAAAERRRLTTTRPTESRPEGNPTNVKRHSIFSFFVAIVALALAVIPAGAQAPQSELNLNAYQCPADYDQISDCTKLSGVTVAVSQDGQPLGTVTSSATEGATLDLMWGAAIALEVTGGAPEGTVLEETDLSFDAVEGQNAVTLIFVGQAVPTGAYLDLVAWYCPANYADLADACDRLGDVYVDVRQDGSPLGQVKTSSTASATIPLAVGSTIDLVIAGGVPERSDLESDADLSFTAVTGANSAMLVFVAQDPAPHEDTNALVVEALVCPIAYEGNNYAADCLGEPDIEVTVTRDADDFTVSDPTGEDGIVAFQGLGEGTYSIELGVPGDFADFITFCGTPVGIEPRELTNPDTNRIGVYLAPVEELTCTFFVIPVDAGGEPTVAPTAAATKAATATPTRPAGQVGRLPDTGAGSTATGATISTGFSLGLPSVLALIAIGGLAARRRPASR
ncbi:MAG: hypothetical protein WKF80_03170 [Thermomicrobiales bacterium]